MARVWQYDKYRDTHVMVRYVSRYITREYNISLFLTLSEYLYTFHINNIVKCFNGQNIKHWNLISYTRWFYQATHGGFLSVILTFFCFQNSLSLIFTSKNFSELKKKTPNRLNVSKPVKFHMYVNKVLYV